MQTGLRNTSSEPETCMPLRYSLPLISMSLKSSMFSSLMQSSYLHMTGIIATDSFQSVHFMASTKERLPYIPFDNKHKHTNSGEGLWLAQFGLKNHGKWLLSSGPVNFSFHENHTFGLGGKRGLQSKDNIRYRTFKMISFYQKGGGHMAAIPGGKKKRRRPSEICANLIW